MTAVTTAVAEVVAEVVWCSGGGSGLDFDPGQHAKGYLLAVVVVVEAVQVLVMVTVVVVTR